MEQNVLMAFIFASRTGFNSSVFMLVSNSLRWLNADYIFICLYSLIYTALYALPRYTLLWMEPRLVPKMEFPRGVFPPNVKTWEWSAVTTVSVSDSRVSREARWMARSNITASDSASLATPSWWPWSILPRNGTAPRQPIRPQPIRDTREQ